MTTTQSNKIKDGINNFLTPVLMVIIGWFVIQSINANTRATDELTERIVNLETGDNERDEWVLAWTEEWMPTLDWAKRQMDKE